MKYFEKDGEVFEEEVDSGNEISGRSVRNQKYDVFKKERVKKSNGKNAIADRLESS